MALRRQIGVTVLLVAVMVAGWLWLWGWSDPTASREMRADRSSPTLVLVETLLLAEDRVVVRAVGTGKALRSASLHPPVAGEVVEVLFEAGQRVEKGAPLLRLDDEHERLAVRLAEIAETEARRQVERYEKLAPSGAVTTAALLTARAELESAGVRLAQARAALRDRTLYAPFDGVIGLPEVEPGDRVTDDTMVATLDDRTSIEVRFTVPEDYSGRIVVGEPVTVRSWSLPDKELRGTISSADSRIDPTTRTLRVKALIPNPDGAIRPGTSFDVQIEFTGRAYPSVPEVAILWSRDGAYLWRVVDDRAEKVFVKMIRRQRGRLLVDGALEAGDLIVVEGVQGLRDGQLVEARVQAVEPDGDPRPAAAEGGA